MLAACLCIVGRAAQPAPWVTLAIGGWRVSGHHTCPSDLGRAEEMASLDSKEPGSTSGEAASAPGFSAPAPDVMLGVWSSWINAASSSAQAWSNNWGDFSTQWWQITPDAAADHLLASGVKQLYDVLAKDPVLRSIDLMWNANPLRDVVPVDWAEIARALRTIWLRSLHQPEKAISSATDLNARILSAATEVWNDAGRRWWVGAGSGIPEGKPSGAFDKRFAAPEWHGNPAYRMLKEIYLLASDWLLRQGEAQDMDDAERQRLSFHLRQFVDAMSPSLLLLSNPEALRRAMETGGASLADGARNLLHDLKEGRLSMVDATAFAPGRNLALTPGKVVHRNRLIELIQYAPSTETVRQIPLLILPPWINKYYILDMQPKNSMVRYLVEQGFTVFVVSWKNPDTSMDGTTIEDYMDLGPLEASEVIREITGSPTVNVMGYCIGGTLLAMTLAWLAAKGDTRFGSATFMVSLQDFAEGGRHGGVSGRNCDRLRRAADDGTRLSRQPRDVQHVQPASLERSDLVERGEQLPVGAEAPRLRSAGTGTATERA